MFDAIYKFLCENQLLTPNQSGFHPGDTTINQLLSITHKIYSAFEEFPSRETKAVFLDISNSFSGALRPGSLTKMVILILNGNGFFNHFQIRRLDTTFARKPSKIMKFGLW